MSDHTRLLAALKRLLTANPGTDDRDEAYAAIEEAEGRCALADPRDARIKAAFAELWAEHSTMAEARPRPGPVPEAKEESEF